jgi:subtilisin family serine protease
MRIQPQNGADWRQASLDDLRPDAGDQWSSIPGLTVGLDALGAAMDAAPLIFLTAPAVPVAPTASPLAMQAPAVSAQPVAGIAAVGGVLSVNPVGNGADQAMQANVARAVGNVTGTGIRIGLLSDSFNVNGGYAADVADGALPAGVTVLKDGPAGSSDEGQAMAELIHQVAPGAQIYFYTAFDGETDFAHGITALANAGCNVIVDDVTYLDEPFFQDGSIIQTAVENVVARGVSYFTSASNEGSNFVQRAFSAMTTALPGLSGNYVAENFGSAARPNAMEQLTVAQGSSITIDLQWDQPFATIGTGHASANSLGLVLYNGNGTIVASALANETGGNPDQILQYTNTSGGTGFSLAIVTNGGAVVPGQFKYIVYGQGVTIDDRAAGIGTGTTIGHEMVSTANTVGAIGYNSTAANGGNNLVESFSSDGASQLLFNASGTRLATPTAAGGVNFVAPDGAATSVFNPFYGTSAAAPNAAGVAALMLQANPTLTPAQVTGILEETATSVRGAAGAVGSGLIDAAAAVRMAASGVAVASSLTGAVPLADVATQAADLQSAMSSVDLFAAQAGASVFTAALAANASGAAFGGDTAQITNAVSGQMLATVNGFNPVMLPDIAQNSMGA